MWVHGGGFISSSPATVGDYAILLAHAGYTVASLDYSLAPGSRYPVPVRQGNAALRYLRANAGRFGGDPARIVLGGDSAGAQIASQLAAVQTDPALARSVGRPHRLPADAGLPRHGHGRLRPCRNPPRPQARPPRTPRSRLIAAAPAA